MGISDVIAIIAIILIVGGATAYIIRAKKNGVKCIGCPDSAACSAARLNGEATPCGGACASCSRKCPSMSTERKKSN